MKRIDHYWNDLNGIALLLMPLSWFFSLLVLLRRFCYRIGLFKVGQLPVPVIVVGNITVGGSGKTPLVIWLADFLKLAGYRPGIVSRGYGGESKRWPQQVLPDSDPRQVGDEPVMIAAHTGCPVWVGPDRVATSETLLTEETVDLIISDDGLQHYRLGRDIEIAVIDGQRRLGNGLSLPAGPLRERPDRLNSVDLVVCNGGEAKQGEYLMRLEMERAVSLAHNRAIMLSTLAGEKVHGVAGIGYPQRFFAALKRFGIEVREHPFPDHHQFVPSDLDFGDNLLVLMTEKDGVKCRTLEGENLMQVPVVARLPDDFGNKLLNMLKR